MLSPIVHYLAVTTIRRARILPVPGKVVARKGQKVNAVDVIAEAKVAPEHVLLEVARGLGLSARKAEKYIQRQPGDEVQEGDVIAGPVGVGRRVVRAPHNGKVVVASGEQVLLEVASKPFEMRAGMPGTITELIDSRGVELQTVGGLVQGVWGNERVDSGMLSVLLHQPNDTIRPEQIDVTLRGAVLLGGHCASAEVFSVAQGVPVRGLILGSMDASLIPAALKAPFPVIVIEGFGHIPMNTAAFRLLMTSNKREVALNAESWDRMADTRPEIIITLPTTSEVPAPKESDHYAPGQQVRIRSAPYMSAVGTLTVIRPGLSQLPSGIRARAADIRLEGGESVLIPLANLEVVA